METIQATKEMWKRLPMSDPHKIEYEMRFNEDQFQKICMGFVPEEMEDKWFIYYEDGWLYCHRSWTGALLFQAQIIKEDHQYKISEFLVERNTEIYKNKNDDHDRTIFWFLINQGLLCIDVRKSYLSSQKMSENAALINWSMFGRMLYREDDDF